MRNRKEYMEHDACGIGAIVNIDGRRTHSAVNDALCIVEHLGHRAGKDASGEVGDGVGILLQISHRFFSRVMNDAGMETPEEKDYAVGMFFFLKDNVSRVISERMFEVIAAKYGIGTFSRLPLSESAAAHMDKGTVEEADVPEIHETIEKILGMR